MITKILDDNAISLIPEESDDLLTLRRIIKSGDRIVGTTTRVIKQDKEYARPDRGDRVKIRIALDVEKISLDNVLDKLRVRGKIIESNNDAVAHGSHHSYLIKLNEGFNLIKKRWNEVEKNLIHSKTQKSGFLLIAIDTTDCGIGRLKGTHLELTPNIYSGSSGKRYKSNFNIEKFFESIQKAIFSSLKEGDTIIIFGPGETRKKFGNYLQKTSIGQKHKIEVIEGIDSGGEDGIYTFTKSESMKEEIIKANQVGAIDSLVFSDKIIQIEDEEKIIEFLNDAEAKGAKTFSADSTTDIGLRVTGLGGIVSLLRFPIEA
jgi:protein pelota